MTIYYGIYILLSIVALWYSNKEYEEKTKRKAICLIGFFSIFLMFALRHQSMGVDLHYRAYYGYLGWFDTISEMSWADVFIAKIANYERGYIILNKLISVLNADRQFFLGTCAFFTLLPIFYIIYKKSVSPFQSIIIYMGLPVFLLTFSGLRQALAIGICTLSLIFIQNKKPIKFILLVLLASFFHYTAIIFLVSYPIYHLKIHTNLRWFTVVAIPIIYILRYPLFTIFSKLFKDDAVATENDSITLFLVFVLIYIFSIICADDSDEQNGLMNLFFLACVCQSFGNIYNTAMRIGYYFMVFLIFLLPSVLNNLSEKADKPFFTSIITVCFMAFGLYSIYNSTWSMAYPYYFYWENVG